MDVIYFAIISSRSLNIRLLITQWIRLKPDYGMQELLSTRMNNLYVEGFDDYVITEMINMLCSE